MLRRFLSFPPSLSPIERSNFRYFLQDIGSWSLYTGSTAIFLTIYASRCGATSEQIGLLTALPALIAIFISLPIGAWIRRFPVQRVTVWAAFGARVFYILFAVLPWVLPTNHQIEGLLVIIAVITIPTTVINISFTQMLMEAIPPEWRGTVIASRSAIGSIGTLMITLLCGQILSRMPFPASYQVVFAMGFVGGMLTVYQIAHIRTLKPPRAAQSLYSEPSTLPISIVAQKQKFFPAIGSQGRAYFRVIGLLFVYGMIANMVAPLIPNLLVHRLGLSDELISIGSSTSTLLVFLVALYIASLTRRTGNQSGTALGIGLLACQTIALSLAHSSGIYLTSAVIGGAASGVINVAQPNYNMDNLPDSDRSSWLSMNNWLGNIAVLLGALCGPAVASRLGTPVSLFLFGGLEAVIGFIIFKWG